VAGKRRKRRIRKRFNRENRLPVKIRKRSLPPQFRRHPRILNPAKRAGFFRFSRAIKSFFGQRLGILKLLKSFFK
jgi:hypothetical protein